MTLVIQKMFKRERDGIGIDCDQGLYANPRGLEVTRPGSETLEAHPAQVVDIGEARQPGLDGFEDGASRRAACRFPERQRVDRQREWAGSRLPEFAHAAIGSLMAIRPEAEGPRRSVIRLAAPRSLCH
jgi:hypothetical protein